LLLVVVVPPALKIVFGKLAMGAFVAKKAALAMGQKSTSVLYTAVQEFLQFPLELGGVWGEGDPAVMRRRRPVVLVLGEVAVGAFRVAEVSE
jgi:hypothetical protein